MSIGIPSVDYIFSFIDYDWIKSLGYIFRFIDWIWMEFYYETLWRYYVLLICVLLVFNIYVCIYNQARMKDFIEGVPMFAQMSKLWTRYRQRLKGALPIELAGLALWIYFHSTVYLYNSLVLADSLNLYF
jgi:hypothetical protein